MGFFKSLKEGLRKTQEKLKERIDQVIRGKAKIDSLTLDELEEILVTADFGVATAQGLIREIEKRVKRSEVHEPEHLKMYLKSEIVKILKPNEAPLKLPEGVRPFTIMVIGVNGVGKTTTIAKMAHRFMEEGKGVLLVAGDTFRAAGIEQLQVWGKRVGVPVIHQKMGSDPSAVAFDALQSAKAKGTDVVIMDTAGRLHTKVNLMDELKKIRRVIGRCVEGAPHEILLVLDATTGQNSIAQAKMFHEAIGVTGIALTKLDGTAKGGILIGLSNELKLPIRYIGIGEGMEDLRDFHAEEFAEALF